MAKCIEIKCRLHSSSRDFIHLFRLGTLVGHWFLKVIYTEMKPADFAQWRRKQGSVGAPPNHNSWGAGPPIDDTPTDAVSYKPQIKYNSLLYLLQFNLCARVV